MRLGLISFALALALVGSAAQAQQSPAGTSYQALSDTFFEMLKQDKAANAVDYLFGTNPALMRMTDQAEQLKGQFASLRTLAGPYVTHAMLVESKVAGMYVYQHYFVAYERQPISVRISYYKRGPAWVCQSLQFDTNVGDLIRKAADSNIRMDTK